MSWSKVSVSTEGRKGEVQVDVLSYSLTGGTDDSDLRRDKGPNKDLFL